MQPVSLPKWFSREISCTRSQRKIACCSLSLSLSLSACVPVTTLALTRRGGAGPRPGCP